MDITDKINVFREAACYLWNTYFKERAQANNDWDLRDEFSNVYVSLFNALVKFDLPESAPSIPHLWDNDKNVLMEYHISGINNELPIMINREMKPSSYWDYPVVRVSQKTDLRLISFFDWGQLGERYMQYYRVRIVNSDDKEIIGRDAFVEVDNCVIRFESLKR